MTEAGRGYIDSFTYDEERKLLGVNGWLCLPGHSFDAFRLNICGEEVHCDAGHSEHLDRAFDFIPNTRPSTFGLFIATKPEDVLDWRELCVTGMSAGADVAQISMMFRLDGLNLPTPPEELRWRVSSSRDKNFYLATAMKTAGEFYQAILQHCAPDESATLLDWGCGCGRVASVVLAFSRQFDVYGCDIDAEAVEWCQANLRGGVERFYTIPLLPPTSFSENQFDIVIGYSVCTHLSRDHQLEWLRELKRITKPGATVFLSVHGEFAVKFVSQDSPIHDDLRSKGISDRTHDANLDGVAPEGYYLGVYQTREYTERVWAQVFDVIDYVERGMGNFHDLVVLRNNK